MIKPECQPTLCFLYSLSDREIINVNYDSHGSLSSPYHPAALIFLLNFPPLANSLVSLFLLPLYHLVSVPVTACAFGVPGRHSHVALVDTRMWPWMAAPWRATREHFKGCMTAGWEIICNPEACAPLCLQSQALQTPRAYLKSTLCACKEMTWHIQARDTKQQSTFWSWPHVEQPATACEKLAKTYF